MTKRYRVEQSGQHYFVRDGVTRRQHGPYPSRRAANGAKGALEELNISAERAHKLHIRAAYRQVKTPGTELYALRRIFPNHSKREIEERAKAQYRAQPIFQGINWALIDELEKAGKRRRAAQTATRGNRTKGTDTRDKVRALWARLADVSIRNRAARIAVELELNPRHVRRVVQELKLK